MNFQPNTLSFQRPVCKCWSYIILHMHFVLHRLCHRLVFSRVCRHNPRCTTHSRHSLEFQKVPNLIGKKSLVHLIMLFHVAAIWCTNSTPHRHSALWCTISLPFWSYIVSHLTYAALWCTCYTSSLIFSNLWVVADTRVCWAGRQNMNTIHQLNKYL